MYTDEDLTSAVKAGIFTDASVNAFRDHTANLNDLPSVDEENFQLVTSFNDIFVVIACALVLTSISLFGSSNELVSAILFSLTSWGLAEFFVLKRRMALPAIVLLISFLAGIFNTSMAMFGQLSEVALISSGVITAVAAWLHWQRFQVPITVAAGTAAAIGGVIAVTIGTTDTSIKQWMIPLLFISGIATFIYAMWWDMADRVRQTRKSDVAFWLHLIAAPLIVHPIFSILGIFDGNNGLFEASAVIALYALMAMLSIAIDRRAMLVSGLAYVLYACSMLLKTYGIDSSSSAITGIIIGGALLLLSVYWHNCRTVLFHFMPHAIQQYLPPLK